jgi:hypothetical protein
MTDLIKRLRSAALPGTRRAALDCEAADEIEHQTDVIRKLNGKCDHQGIRLGEVIAERDALRADAERYRWLRSVNPALLCQIAWRVKAACQFGDCDAAIDAARREKRDD